MSGTATEQGGPAPKELAGGKVKVDTVNECPLFKGEADLELILQSPGAEALKRDDARSEAVKRVQKAIQALGFHIGAIDGKLGKRTAGAVAEFQKAKVAEYAKRFKWPEPIEPPFVEGEVGFLTLNAMDEAIGRSKGDPPKPPPHAKDGVKVPAVPKDEGGDAPAAPKPGGDEPKAPKPGGDEPKSPAQPKEPPKAPAAPPVVVGSAKAWFDEEGWFHIDNPSAASIPAFHRFDPPTPNLTKGTPGKHKEWMVVHYTAGSGDHMRPGRLMKEGGGASTHFLIARDGSLSQLASIWDGTWHAGGISARDPEKLYSQLQMSPKPKSGNDRSLGLDFCNLGWFTAFDAKKDRYTRNGASLAADRVVQAERHNLKYWEKYYEPQLRTFVILMKAIVKFHPAITRNRVVGHEDTRATKTDPGPALPFAALLDQIFG